MSLRSSAAPPVEADAAALQLVADEQIVDDLGHFFLGQQEEPGPPPLEFEKALDLGVDVGIEVIGLGPERVGRIQALEVGDQIGAVELAAAEIAQQGRDPGAAQQAAHVTHRIFAIDAGPVGHRRAANHDRTHQPRLDRRQRHHRPAGLAVADHAGLALGFGVQLGDFLDETRFRRRDIAQGLTRHRLGVEHDEIGGMAGAQRHSDLAVLLHPAHAGAVAGARIDDDERPLLRIDGHARLGVNPEQGVVRRPFEGARVEHDIVIEIEDRRFALGAVFEKDVAALAHRVPEQDRTLHRRQPHSRTRGSAMLAEGKG
jgi:hypothetical protein